MKRILQFIGVKPECLEAYCKLHDNIWPEVTEVIKQAHLENYSIFHFEGKLFQYMEYTGDNIEHDMQQLSQCDAMQRWCEICKTMQIPDSGQWCDTAEVFHLE